MREILASAQNLLRAQKIPFLLSIQVEVNVIITKLLVSRQST